MSTYRALNGAIKHQQKERRRKAPNVVMAIDTNVPAQVVVSETATKEAAKKTAMAKMSQSKMPAKNGANGVVKRMPIGEGETATRAIEILDDKHVKASFTFKLDENSKARYAATVLLDYTGCTLAEILTDATRSHVITLQRNLRGMGDGALDANVYKNVDVKRDLIETTRSSVDPETRGLHAFAKAADLSHDVVRKILAAIKAGTLKLD